MKIESNINLAPYTYYKIGGPAKYFATPETENDLETLSDFILKQKIPFFILGAGSNLLVSDSGFNGLVIRMTKLNQKIELDNSHLKVGSGVLVIQALRYCMQNGIDGLKSLVGIPGSMGGVFAMNAGTKNGEIKDQLQQLRIYNLVSKKIKTLIKDELKYSYRKNHFLTESDIILEGILNISAQHDPKIIQNEITSLLEQRKKSQPIDKPSCGSVFKNPDQNKGLNAWKLISDAGLRGHQIGAAQISSMHCNFIINLGGATANDVRSLIQLAKDKVFQNTGIKLEEEVQFLGF